MTDLLADDPDRFVVTFDRAGTRTPEHPTRPEIQLLSPDFYGPRFEELTTWMRAEAPMYWDDTVGIWGAAAYEDVKRLSREWRTFCSGQGSRPESSVPSMINMDPPEHTRRRRMVSAGFTLRRVQDHEPYLRERVTELIDSVVERGECDIVADIATPLPMYMIGELMGLPEEDHAQLLHWSDLFATGGEEIRDEVVEAVRAYSAYILERRRPAPRRHGRGPRQPRRQRRRRAGPAERPRPRLRDDARARRRRRDDPPRHLRRRRGAAAPPRPAGPAARRARAAARARSRRCCAGSARSAT